MVNLRVAPIPTNLITGRAGVGKTAAVLDVLHRRPAGERWAVLVVGDAAKLAAAAPAGTAVRGVAGGCPCCSPAPVLGAALHFLLADGPPDRLLVEAGPAAHPAGLLDALRTRYAGRLAVRATVGLVGPADLADPASAEVVALADVLVLNRLDEASPEQVERFRLWADALDPPKLLVAATAGGRLDPAWLDLV